MGDVVTGDVHMTVVTGGCVCGGVRYEVTEPFVSANYCHCTRCQRRTGTASSANARAADGSFRIVQGQELEKVWDPGGGGFRKAFCSNCGAAPYSCNPALGADVGARLGTVDGPPGIRPQKRRFADCAAVWGPTPDDGLPGHPES